MMGKRTVLGLSLALLMSAGSVIAAPNGPYAGIGGGSSSMDSASTDETFKDTSLKVFLGYQLSDKLAAEIAYSSYGELIDVPGTTSTIEVSGLEASVLGKLPVNSKFSLFGRVGFWAWDASIPFYGSYLELEDGVDPFFGAGLEYNPTDKLQLRFEVNQHEIADTDGTTVNGTVAMRF